MADDALAQLSIAEASARIRRKELSPVELVQAVLARLQATEPRVHAYAYVCAESAIAQARRAEEKIDGDYRGPLHGIPINLKDLYYTAGIPTEGGSRVLRDNVPTWDSTVAGRLKTAGAILIGKTVTNEFGLGFNTVKTRNAWNADAHPGSSSAGAAVSVAVGSSLAGLGTDTGGSTRVPAALNGIVGLKPTYGLVSRYGIIPLCYSLDHAGILTRTAHDAALVLNTLAGFDENDPASARVPAQDYAAGLDEDIRGVRVGFEQNHFLRDATADVRGAYQNALSAFGTLGAECIEVTFDRLELAAAAGLTILFSEASAVHHHWMRTRASDYESVTRNGLALGALLPAEAYVRAQAVRRVIANELRCVFETNQLDALVVPTTPGTTMTLTELAELEQGSADSNAWSGQLRHGIPFNLSGQPALSVPCGASSRGLPMGLQIIGRPFQDAMVLRIAHAFESTMEMPLPNLI